ncbi:hypothetical protein K4L06_10365 [Lysobacter sp. BMK333-48F3]|uniref:hypothetical protein n=1 Tax=Lysobacter sp. BMK333-48F3 TaxID=2867962 RepID=UPI001C8BDC82|nr:hypothetical protein [Lysobacter sp. BMK333-48F3]MBX9401715.1 hypothetical protein [Lysobacter sp. BMK333-48F3]
MSESIKIQAEAAYAIARTFSDIADRILELRITAPDVDDEQARELERHEDQVRMFVVLFRKHGTLLLGEGAAQAAADLSGAIGEARDALQDIAQIKRALRIAGAVVALTIALQAGKVKAVSKAITAVVDTAKQPATA